MTAPSIDERRQPGLSETLGILIDPRMCRSCGSLSELTRWRECDENDRPTMAVVVLCQRCSKKVIDRHPRLYIELQPHEPFPGVMEICVDCPARDGVSCTSLLAKHNGGPGMAITGVRASRGILCSGRHKGHGGCMDVRIYYGSATDCAGKQEILRLRLVD